MKAFLYVGFVFFGSMLLADQSFTEQEITEIYQRYVQVNETSEYEQRYVPLPMYRNSKSWRWEGKDFPRVIALLEFERYVNEHNLTSQKALAINGAVDPEWEVLPHKILKKADYEKEPLKYDLHILNLPEKDFDFIMVNQTLEHVYDPIRCLKNIHKHLKKGGILYFNVPVTNIPHETPFHFYTGFTPVGLGAIVQLAGFEILSIGQWGNQDYLRKAFATRAFPDYRELLNPGFNEINCPIIAWVFACKK